MKHKMSHPPGNVFLGIEGGGTRTVALAADDTSRLLRRLEAGPANLQLLSDGQLVGHLRLIRRRMPWPVALGIGLAGARTEPDKARIRAAAEKVWPGISCSASSDLETGLMAATPSPGSAARVLVLSGTGSCCFGRNAAGESVRVGGWGHILGDKGSGYDISLRAMQGVVSDYDFNGAWSKLGARFLRALQLNEPEDLVGWAQGASKAEMAALALEVFEAAKEGDKIARQTLAGAAQILAWDAVVCAGKLAHSGAKVQFILAGGVLLKEGTLAGLVKRELKRLWPTAVMASLERESAWGAVELARLQLQPGRVKGARRILPKAPARSPVSPGEDRVPAPPDDLRQLPASPTEQRNPRSMDLDKRPLRSAITLMLEEESRTAGAVLAERKKLEKAIELVVAAFRRGGRLFYAGAGTSGRLGVLDASECPPTFNVSPEMVQGIMAGGQRALWESVEGAEDDAGAGARAIEFRRVGREDVVLGIAASGRTPFVWGALEEARRRKAKTILLTFNPGVIIPPAARPNIVIAPNVGPEVLTGSTRLKAGTGTKLVLNVLTTLAMVRLGKVKSNLMIDVRASNTKLRDRATRILQQLTGAEYAAAQQALQKCQWNIPAAAKRLRKP